MFRVRLKAPTVEDRIIELGHRDTQIGSSQIDGLAPRHFFLRKTKDGVRVQLINHSLPIRGGLLRFRGQVPTR